MSYKLFLRLFRGRAIGAQSRSSYLFSAARTFLSAAAYELQHGLDSPPLWNISRCCGQECPRSAKHVGSSALRTIALVAIGAVLVGLTGCSRPSAQRPSPPAVTVAPVERREVVEWDEFTGRTEPVQSVEVRP